MPHNQTERRCVMADRFKLRGPRVRRGIWLEGENKQQGLEAKQNSGGT